MVETVGWGQSSSASRLLRASAETGGREGVMFPTDAAGVEIDSSVDSARLF